MKLRLITPYWKPDQPRRNAELRYCEKVNAEIVDEVVMPKGRPTYLDLFKLCEPDRINVIANSDIYFDESINLAKGMNENECYALTRYDNGRLWHKGHLSQDVWIFNGAVKQELLQREVDFNLGVPGCDNRIAYEIHKAGYSVLNPSLSIKTHHNHDSKFRTYDRKKEKIKPPYMLIHPIRL